LHLGVVYFLYTFIHEKGQVIQIHSINSHRESQAPHSLFAF
jgi:hypothetical protein